VLGPQEQHVVGRIGWIRAAILGANDGIVSTASLILGVAAASAGRADILLAGGAGLVAGAMSMAAGEFVSVSSQRDTEKAELLREGRELKANPKAEEEELAAIYFRWGLDCELARQVERQMMAKNALAAHARDELGISESIIARPVQAAIASAISFSAGAVLPLAVVLFAPLPILGWTVAGCSTVFLAILGVAGAKIGGARILTPALRVTFWGVLAMAVTAGAGLLIGKAV
jgi:VIT1/CCC1 family predicted Fe2+/Mn2+ transporter